MLNPLLQPPTIPSSKFSISLVLLVCFVCCNCCRVLLAPIYATIGWLLAWKLQCHRGAIWRCIYVCAVVVSLITAHLLEIRYFTPGVVVFCLNLPKVRQIGCAMLCRKHFFYLVELFFYMHCIPYTINCTVLYCNNCIFYIVLLFIFFLFPMFHLSLI